jgi:hypothetical protein
MITAIQIAIFLVAFFSKKKYVTLILALASLVVPDEIPMIDEILMLAATMRGFYLDSKEKASREQQEQIAAGNHDDDVGA